METHSRPPLLGARRPSWTLGIVVAIASVALVTVAIYPLRAHTPTASSGVVYLLPVLIASAFWGLWLGLFTSVLSAAAFNWFHIPPTGRFTIAETENWVALGMFFITALVVSSVAELARTRAQQAQQHSREAEMSAELARLFSAAPLEQSLDPAATLIAAALELEDVSIELGHFTMDGPANRVLRANGVAIGALRIRGEISPEANNALNQSLIPALEALLAASMQRETLTAEVVDKQAFIRSDQLKTALLRAVSHDLRSPLTALSATGEALQSPNISDSERMELARAVSSEAGRLSSLVEKLLDLSRLQAGATNPRRDWCAIDEIVDAAAAAATSHTHDIEVRIDGELPLVRADAAQLERAIANLLENGLRYSEGKPLTVTLRASAHALTIRVVDQGPGIPAAELERVFEPFHRLGQQNSHGGAGLGLAIVRGLVEANGGSVHAESLPSQGACFVIELPLGPTAEGQP